MDYDLIEDFIAHSALNDADGSDEDLYPYEYGNTRLFMAPVNHWQDDIFIVDSTEGGYGIIFDSVREDVRFSAIFSHRIDTGDLHEILLTKGKSYDKTSPGPYTPTKRIVIPGRAFPHDYEFFLDVNNKGMILLSSIQKFRGLVERYLRLGVFS